jgi:hypothetical protein
MGLVLVNHFFDNLKWVFLIDCGILRVKYVFFVILLKSSNCSFASKMFG